jgi:hypothetical protein
MWNVTAVQSIAPAASRGGEFRSARELLYKADHPRDIDQVINFFGDPGSLRGAAEGGRELERWA